MDRIKGTSAWWGSACVIAALYVFSPNFLQHHGASHPLGGDFLQEWIGGWMVRHGEGPRLYDVPYVDRLQHDPQIVGMDWDRTRYLPMVYPPFYYVLVSPWSCLTWRVAAWGWAAVLVTSYFGAWYLVTRRPCVPVNGNEAKLAVVHPAWMVLTTVSAPFLENLASSQKATLGLLVLAASWRFLQKGDLYVAGLVLGLLACKPTWIWVFVICMIWQRQWRVVAGVATTTLGLVMTTLPWGWEVWQDYLHLVFHAADYVHHAGYELHRSHSLYGTLALMAHGETSTWVRGGTLVGMAWVVICLHRLFREGAQWHRPIGVVQWMALWMATVLCSPHWLGYDLTLLTLPAAMLVTAAPSRQQKAIGCVIALSMLLTGTASYCAEQFGIQLTTMGLMLGLGWLAHFAEQRGAADASALGGTHFMQDHHIVGT